MPNWPHRAPHTPLPNIGSQVRGVKYIELSDLAPHTQELGKNGDVGVWGVGVRCELRGDAILAERFWRPAAIE